MQQALGSSCFNLPTSFVWSVSYLYRSLFLPWLSCPSWGLFFFCLVWLVARPPLCGCCWLVVPGGWLLDPRGPQGYSGWLVGRVRVWKILGLLPTHWQVKPDPGISTRLLVGRAGSWSLGAGLKDPKVPLRLFRGVGSWYSWLWGFEGSGRFHWLASG